MDVFNLRQKVIADYGSYVRSFLTIKDDRINRLVQEELDGGHLWPDPLIQLNPCFEPGESLDELVANGEIHPQCLQIFAAKEQDGRVIRQLRLHRHQVEGIRSARAGDNYVLTTGTGSGKSLSYIVPIVDHVLRRGSGKGIQAIVVYPMNALANSQLGELEKFLCRGFPAGKPPVTFKRYTGQEKDQERNEIIATPPDILLTNFVMLELILTRPVERRLIEAAQRVRFLVLDELHTYRGRQGSDVAMLVRRVREACEARNLIHVGTSATLAGSGTWQQQQAAVSEVASQIFGAAVKPERVIGETLTRATRYRDPSEPSFAKELTERLRSGTGPQAGDTGAFVADPLASWIESTLGVREEPVSGRLIRCQPRPLSGDGGAAAALMAVTGEGLQTCEDAIRQVLLVGHSCPDKYGYPLFAFRLNQFVSKGEYVYASPEPESERYITLQAQQFVPHTQRQRTLLPIAFCRECGQEYYVVRRGKDEQGRGCFIPREVSDRIENDDGEAGYLYMSEALPWPEDPVEVLQRLPDAWLEIHRGMQRVRKSRRKDLPAKIFISGAAIEGAGDQPAWWLPSPFRFCLSCGIAYSSRQSSDFGKLSTLGSEGRSTATTVMSLSTIRSLRKDTGLDLDARKLLSFTDNRQDASLQAGHFNDFVEVSLLRSALWRAVKAAGDEGIRHEALTRRVFESLALPLELYASNPVVEYFQKEETERALREALGYYIYQDLRRGWRITAPNLEQCGLLGIDYVSLTAFCGDEIRWEETHPALATSSPEDRENVCRVLLDFLRRELAIRVSYLDPVDQEAIRQLSAQYLIAPWALDEQDELERGRVIFPKARGEERAESRNFVYLSPRGGFGLYLKRPGTFPVFDGQLKLEDVEQILPQLLEQLMIPGLVHRVMEPRFDGDVPGYQLNASALVWRSGSGEQAYHDPIRVPRAPEGGLRTNPHFIELYEGDSDDLKRLEAREHTAQVAAEVREQREEAFREARLPILYCSPTMELGVDIRQLNVVNMRNVPPTPANYAQRSGRAGRSGQPAFVYTYCASGSPHDQYFFKHPELMVGGAVTTPRLDLSNPDLVRAHVYAIWLGASGLSLGRSLQDVLDVSGEDPTLALLGSIRVALADEHARSTATLMAEAALGAAIRSLVGPQGDPKEWLDQVLRELPNAFDAACNRWRGLYLAALNQSKRQGKIVIDPSRDPRDRERAKGLRAEAEAQLKLLLETGQSEQSDFYSYRYFASEGFLPGYNFPRLPLSAFLPGRRKKKGVDEFLTRPRFLAISEFGPRSFIYHEGSRFSVNKVILPIDSDETTLTRRAVQCEACGFIHPLGDEPGPDLCESCGCGLPQPFDNLFRMQNVSTRRRDRINSDEEERFRLGYELKTGLRFAERRGELSAQNAVLRGADGGELASLIYGHAATIWRMNLGWTRRADKDRMGYVLDVERGFWARNQAVDDDPEDPLSPRTVRVIPYVEDHRNCILLRPAEGLSCEVMASLEAALKAAIQVCFQVEDRELATEPLPGRDQRKQILLYESAEGGAGVLRQLVEDPQALPMVARMALERCHFDPDTGEDLGKAKKAREECEAACYDCLLSYYNQRDHRLLDRKLLVEVLRQWQSSRVETSPSARPRREQVERLARLCQTELERKWLARADRLGLRLPSHAQMLIEGAHARPDFFYEDAAVAVLIDGPVHDTPEQQAKDSAQQDELENLGLSVIRFHHSADWLAIFMQYPSLFGGPAADVEEA